MTSDHPHFNIPVAKPLPSAALGKPAYHKVLIDEATPTAVPVLNHTFCSLSVATTLGLARIGDVDLEILGRQEDYSGASKYPLRISGPDGSYIVIRQYREFEEVHHETFGDRVQALAMPRKSFWKSVFSPKFQAEQETRLLEIADAAIAAAANVDVENCPPVLRAFLGLDEMVSETHLIEASPRKSRHEDLPSKKVAPGGSFAMTYSAEPTPRTPVIAPVAARKERRSNSKERCVDRAGLCIDGFWLHHGCRVARVADSQVHWLEEEISTSLVPLSLSAWSIKVDGNSFQVHARRQEHILQLVWSDGEIWEQEVAACDTAISSEASPSAELANSHICREFPRVEPPLVESDAEHSIVDSVPLPGASGTLRTASFSSSSSATSSSSASSSSPCPSSTLLLCPPQMESASNLEELKAERKEEAEARVQAEAEDWRKEEEAKEVQLQAELKAQAEAKQEEARLREEAEAQRKAEEEARLRAEAEARRKAEEEEAARLQAKAEAWQKAVEEARLRAEAEAWRKAEEEEAARLQAEAEATLRVELETQQKAEAEAVRLQAEAEARQKAEEEARLRVELEAQRKAQEEEATCVQAEAQARQKAEQEAQLQAELEAHSKSKKEEEARVQAEAEARRKADEEVRIQAELEAQAEAKKEEARLQEEAEAQRKAEEEARLRAEAEARRNAEEEEAARLRAEEMLVGSRVCVRDPNMKCTPGTKLNKGRRGLIILNVGDDMPWKVLFYDDQRPKLDWFSSEELEADSEIMVGDHVIVRERSTSFGTRTNRGRRGEVVLKKGEELNLKVQFVDDRLPTADWFDKEELAFVEFPRATIPDCELPAVSREALAAEQDEDDQLEKEINEDSKDMKAEKEIEDSVVKHQEQDSKEAQKEQEEENPTEMVETAPNKEAKVDIDEEAHTQKHEKQDTQEGKEAITESDLVKEEPKSNKEEQKQTVPEMNQEKRTPRGCKRYWKTYSHVIDPERCSLPPPAFLVQHDGKQEKRTPIPSSTASRAMSKFDVYLQRMEEKVEHKVEEVEVLQSKPIRHVPAICTVATLAGLAAAFAWRKM